jgi:hypothetical protein
MLPDLRKFVTETYEKYRDKTIRLVAIPVPPVPVKGVIFKPDSFSSKSYDGNHEIYETEHDEKVVSSHWTEHGPALLVYLPLKTLIKITPEGYLTVDVSTFCATISYLTFEKHGITYAKDATLDCLSLIARSCHPGSHYTVPQAPYLTALLQFAQAPNIDEDNNRERERSLEINQHYLSPWEAEMIFPTVPWDKNKEIDEFISKCVVNDVSFFKTFGGPGQWSIPYLRTLNRNRFNFSKPILVDTTKITIGEDILDYERIRTFSRSATTFYIGEDGNATSIISESNNQSQENVWEPGENTNPVGIGNPLRSQWHEC